MLSVQQADKKPFFASVLSPEFSGPGNSIQTNDPDFRCFVPGWLAREGFVPYHVPGAGPAAFHSCLVDGLGLEAWGHRSCATGHHMHKRQRAVTQLRLSPGRNFIGGVCCQIGH